MMNDTVPTEHKLKAIDRTVIIIATDIIRLITQDPSLCIEI